MLPMGKPSRHSVTQIPKANLPVKFGVPVSWPVTGLMFNPARAPSGLAALKPAAHPTSVNGGPVGGLGMGAKYEPPK